MTKYNNNNSNHSANCDKNGNKVVTVIAMVIRVVNVITIIIKMVTVITMVIKVK